jgi:hypothetical protein
MSARKLQAASDGEAQIHSWRETLALLQEGRVVLQVDGSDATEMFAAALTAQISLMRRIVDVLRD